MPSASRKNGIRSGDEQEQPRGDVDVVGEDHDHGDQRRHPEVDEGAEDRGQRKDKSREVDLRDHRRVGEHDAGGPGHRRVEDGPRLEAHVSEHEVGHAIGVELGDSAEHEREHARGEQRRSDDPDRTEDGLAVADGDVTDAEYPEELAEAPELPEVREQPTAAAVGFSRGRRPIGLRRGGRRQGRGTSVAGDGSGDHTAGHPGDRTGRDADQVSSPSRRAARVASRYA